MKLLDVTLENYGSFKGLHRFAVSDRGLVFVQGENRDDPRSDSNGAGKSTLFDALDWCLFGVVPKGDGADSIINETAKRNTCVTVRIFDEEDEGWILIQRYRKLKGKSGVRLWCWSNADPMQQQIAPMSWTAVQTPPDQFELTAMDTAATQLAINTALGVDRMIYRAAVYRAQNDEWSFADARDSDRKILLTKILGLEELDIALDRTKALYQSTQATEAEVRQKTEVLNTQIAGLTDTDYESMSEAWDKEHGDKLTALEINVQNLRDRWVRLRSAVERYHALREQIDAVRKPIIPVAPTRQPDMILGTLTSTLEQVRGVKQKADSALAEARGRIAAVMRAQVALDAEDGLCPTCGAEISVVSLVAERDRVRQELADLELSQSTLVDVKDKAAGELTKASSAVEDRRVIAEAEYAESVRAHMEVVADLNSRYSLGIAELDTERLSLRYAVAEMPKVEAQGRVAGELMETAEHEENPFVSLEVDRKNKLKTLGEELSALSAQTEELNERLGYLSFWTQGFGAKGLKSYVLDAKLQALTDAANFWIRILTGGVVWVRFETQTATKAGTLSERFSVRVFRHNPDGTITERPFRSWSGGEKRRTARGIDLGLSHLVASRARKKWNFVIFDEVFQNLDSGGRAAMHELLGELSHSYDSIFVIDHDADFKGGFENTMTVIREDRESRVVG